MKKILVISTLLVAFNCFAMKSEGQLFPYNESGFGGDNDYFGHSISVENDFMVVGSSGPGTHLSYDFGNGYGVAYVYQRIDGDWVLQQILTNPLDISFQFRPYIFAEKVFIENNKIFISIANGQFPSGSVAGILVYHYIDGKWVYDSSIEQPDINNQYFSAHDFSVFENVLVVGNPFMRLNGLIKTGVAYIYEFDPSNDSWEFVKEITAHVPEENDQFGYDVEVSENLITIYSAYYPNSNHKMFVFEKTNGTWDDGTKFPSNPISNFSLNGIDTYNNEIVSLTESGPTVFSRVDGNWSVKQILTHPNYDLSDTYQVYMKEDVIICSLKGSIRKDVIFKKANNTWQAYDSIEPETINNSEISIGYSNNQLMYGEYYDDPYYLSTQRGQVHLYENDSITFSYADSLLPDRGGYMQKLGEMVVIDNDVALVSDYNGIHEFNWFDNEWNHVFEFDFGVSAFKYKDDLLLLFKSSVDDQDLYTYQKINGTWELINQNMFQYYTYDSFTFNANYLAIQSTSETISLYHLINDEWIFDKDLILPPNTRAIDMSINDTHLLVGNSAAEIAHLYNLDSGQKVQSLNSEVSMPRFGDSVELNGNNAIITGSSLGSGGHSTVHQYQLQNDSLTFTQMLDVEMSYGEIINTEIDGDYILIHSHESSSGQHVNDFLFQIFKYKDGQWTPHTKKAFTSFIRHDETSSSLSGNRLVIGQHLEHDKLFESGRADVYDISFSDLIFSDGFNP